MSFFYAKDAPEYKDHKNPEGAFVPENRAWHEANRTYTFSYGLGALIMSISILVFLGIFLPESTLVGDARHHYDVRHTILSCHHARSLGSESGWR